jgi:hypothetical protein
MLTIRLLAARAAIAAPILLAAFGAGWKWN